MMYRGDVEDRSTVSGRVQGRLFDFPVNSAQLGSRHMAWLDDHVIPMISAGGSATVTGEASRTGAADHNLSLSRRRARSVVSYVSRYARGTARCSDTTSRHGVTARGDGESGAEAIGQRDGMEDGFFRAVRVVASWQPVPPPPPSRRRRRRAQPFVRRVTRRRWRTTRNNTPELGNSGEGGATAANMIHDMIDYRRRGGSDTREHAWYRAHWAVVRVRETLRIDETLVRPLGPLPTRRITREIRYYWGPRTPQVLHDEESIVIDRNRHMTSDRTSTVRSREEVWRHVAAPDAPVFAGNTGARN